MLLGNALAGHQFLVPQFVFGPLPLDGNDQLATGFPSTIPTSAITRSMSKTYVMEKYMTLNDTFVKTYNV